MPSSIDLSAERANVWEQMKSLQTDAEKENRSFSAEESEKWEQMEKDLESLTERIERAEEVEERDREFAKPLRRRGPVESREENPERETRATATPQYRKAWTTWVREGANALTSEERDVLHQGYQEAPPEVRALAAGTGSAGGFTVPQEFYDRLYENLKDYGGVRESRATVLRTASGADMPMSLVDDTGNVGAILSENTQVTEQDATFTQKTLKSYMYTSKLVRASFQLLQDAEVDIEAWLAKALGTRIARITNQHFTTGTGTSQPEGFVTNAGVGKQAATGNTTTWAYDDVIDLIHSVDPAYRRNAEFMINDGLLKAARKIKDSQNNPIWQPGLNGRESDTIAGYPYIVNQDMAAPAASAKSGAFGDFSYYLIRDVRDVTVLRLAERYADFLQVGFLAFSRHDGLYANPGTASTGPIKVFQHSAT